jgi:hypothetical protein
MSRVVDSCRRGAMTDKADSGTMACPHSQVARDRTMHTHLWRLLRLLLCGTLLLEAAGSGCLADSLRDISENLDDLAGDIDGSDDDESFGDIIDGWLD